MTASLPRLTLVLGGARSGKSRYAESLVRKLPPPWVYIATAEALDEEMRGRIAEHAARRGDGWTTIEAPVHLEATVLAHGASDAPVLIDCLTIWLSNILLAGRSIPAECDRLCAALAAAKGPLVVVSNEVGLGIVPDTKLGRDFRDVQGHLNAQVAALADHVVFMAAGLPLIIKQP